MFFHGFGMLLGHFFYVFSWLWDGFRVVSSCFVKLALRLVPYLFSRLFHDSAVICGSFLLCFSGVSGIPGVSRVSGGSGVSRVSGVSKVSRVCGVYGDSGVSGVSGISGIPVISGVSGIS